MLNFNNPELDVLVSLGELEDIKSREFICNAVGINKKKVEASRHTILSGPPGVGKSYGTMDECSKNNVNYLLIPPGISDIELACKLAVAVYELKEHEELVVILDDADDVVFGNYATLNKWKIAMGDINYDIGQIPYYAHSVSMINTLSSLDKQTKAGNNKQRVIDAIRAHQTSGDIGMVIPTDRVRFVVLCNLDLENPRAYSSAKMRSAVMPVLDRFNYKRMNLDIDRQWGWLAFVLSNTQPFEEQHLDDQQKTELLQWMREAWDDLRSTSYRTVRKLAADMINEPKKYRGLWNEQKRGH